MSEWVGPAGWPWGWGMRRRRTGHEEVLGFFHTRSAPVKHQAVEHVTIHVGTF
jgi:hypothetical protein